MPLDLCWPTTQFTNQTQNPQGVDSRWDIAGSSLLHPPIPCLIPNHAMNGKSHCLPPRRRRPRPALSSARQSVLWFRQRRRMEPRLTVTQHASRHDGRIRICAIIENPLFA